MLVFGFVSVFVVVGASEGGGNDGDDDDDGEVLFCDGGPLAGVNTSESTDLSTRRPNGSVNSERRPDGNGSSPCVIVLLGCGMCKNLFRAAGDERVVQMTSERKSKRCTYHHHHHH